MNQIIPSVTPLNKPKIQQWYLEIINIDVFLPYFRWGASSREFS